MKKFKENLTILIVIFATLLISVILLAPNFFKPNLFILKNIPFVKTPTKFVQYPLPSDSSKGVIQNFVGLNAGTFGHDIIDDSYSEYIAAPVNNSNYFLKITYISDNGGIVWGLKNNPNYDADADSGPDSESQIETDNRDNYKVISQSPKAGTSFTIDGTDEPNELILHVKKIK